MQQLPTTPEQSPDPSIGVQQVAGGLETAQVTLSAHFPVGVNGKFFGALSVFPTGRLYENLEEDEQVMLVIGRHWISRVVPLVGGMLLAVLPLAVLGIELLVHVPGLILRYSLMIAWFWYAFILYYFLSLFVVWKSDVYIVTNERIVDFDARTISHKTVKDTDLASVHEITYATGGGLVKGSIDYGDVTMKAMKDEVVMENIPMPSQVALALGELIELAKKSKGVATH